MLEEIQEEPVDFRIDWTANIICLKRHRKANKKL
jgi:hypothetical protein